MYSVYAAISIECSDGISDDDGEAPVASEDLDFMNVSTSRDSEVTIARSSSRCTLNPRWTSCVVRKMVPDISSSTLTIDLYCTTNVAGSDIKSASEKPVFLGRVTVSLLDPGLMLEEQERLSAVAAGPKIEETNASKRSSKSLERSLEHKWGGPVLKEGFMHKLALKSHKNWKKRYFRLFP